MNARHDVIIQTKGRLRGRGKLGAGFRNTQRERELKERLKRARAPVTKPKGKLPNPQAFGLYRDGKFLRVLASDERPQIIVRFYRETQPRYKWTIRRLAPGSRIPAKRNGFFDSAAIARAKKVKRIHRVQERDTKEGGEIIGVQPGGFIKVKWDNRERPTLIKRSEIKRYPRLRMNPGIMELAGGLQALDYLGEKVGVGKRKRNPKQTVYVDRLTGRQWEAWFYHSDEGRKTATSTTSATDAILKLVNRWDIRDYKIVKVNPSVNEMSERFQGRATGKAEEYYFSNSAPRLDMSRGGRLIFLKIKGTTIRVPQSVVAIDAKLERLWLGCKSATGMFKRKAKPGERLDYGDVDAICYETAKAHIGGGKPFEYHHTFGEDGGRKPRLLVDNEGMPILQGGDYKIEDRGIVN